MKKVLVFIFIFSLIIPQVTHASWWNPTTWFDKKEVKIEMVEKTVTPKVTAVQSTSTPPTTPVKTAPTKVIEKQAPVSKTIEKAKTPAPPATTQPAKQQNCHPSYSGCLRADASDYDCAKGSGNGPYYTGAVQVIGPDVFDLDRDNDGWGCE